MDANTVTNPQLWTMPMLATLAVVLATILLIKSLEAIKKPVNAPPYPARAWPVFGHLLYLRGGMRSQMKKWAKSSGDIFSLRFGSKPFVVLNSYKLVHQAFVKHADALTDRPPSLGIAAENNVGILTSSGHVWKEQRTISLQILRSFGMGKNILALKVSEEASAYLDVLAQLAGKPTDVRTLTNTAVSNIICSIIVGKRFEFDDEYFTNFINILSEHIHLAALNNVSSNFRWLRFLPGDRFKAKRRKFLFDYVQTRFCEHYIQKTETELNDNDVDNFISAYIVEMRKMENHGKETTLDKKNLTRVLFNLFIAGTETTSTTMLWFMVYMLHFPKVQDKIFKEIEEIVGTQRPPTMQDRAKLHFTNAAIYETQRLASIVPFGLPHYCTEEIVLANYTIPAGTTVIANFDSILLSEETWKDPLEFRPERFLDSDGGLMVPDELMPFSIGRRLCLGEALAKMELFLFLTALIQKFDLRPAEYGQLPERKSVDGVTSPPEPFQIRFVDRQEC